MAARKRASADLTGIRQRGNTYQVRIFGGTDPVTGKQVMLTGSADSQASAIELRDRFREQVRDRTAVRTNMTLGYLLAEWLAGHQVEPTTRAGYAVMITKFIAPVLGEYTLTKLAQLGSRPYEQLYAELRVCRRRCHGTAFTEHRTPRTHECDARCKPHVCKPLAPSTIRQCHAVLSSAYAAAVRWGWIAFNPMESAQKPRPPASQQQPLAQRHLRTSWEMTFAGSRPALGLWPVGRASVKGVELIEVDQYRLRWWQHLRQLRSLRCMQRRGNCVEGVRYQPIAPSRLNQELMIFVGSPGCVRAPAFRP